MNSFETQQLARELKTTPEQRLQWLTKAFRLVRASLSCRKTRKPVKRLEGKRDRLLEGRQGGMIS